ncbi:hypothetical protein QFZ38_005129 [Pseudomonas cedrina]|nr:hypothetical protein [Pseudomonas cedrina]
MPFSYANVVLKAMKINVGAGLPAKTSTQQTLMLTGPPQSRASPLPQGVALTDWH